MDPGRPTLLMFRKHSTLEARKDAVAYLSRKRVNRFRIRQKTANKSNADSGIPSLHGISPGKIGELKT